MITGVDYRDRFPRYGSPIGAGRILLRHGGVEGIVSSVLGDPQPLARAIRGDLVAGDFGQGMTVAVVVGVHCCAPGAAGLIFWLTSKSDLSWRV